MTRPTFTGPGFFAGEAPDGLTTVAGVPTRAQVRVYWRDPSEEGDVLVASTESALDGSWRIANLNPDLSYVVRAQKPSFDDVTVVGVQPSRSDAIDVLGELQPTALLDGLQGELLLNSGLTPFTATVMEPLPYGLTPALNGRTLTIEGTSSDEGVWESTVRVTAGNGVWVDVPMEVTIEAPGDPHWDHVALLLHMEGVNGSTVFADSSPRPKAITAHGNAQIGTARSKFGGSSLLLDGNGDYLSFAATPDAGFGAGDWTVEGWFYPSGAQTGNRFLLDMRVATGSSFMVWCSQTNAANRIGFSNEVGTGFVSGGSWLTNAWNHWAVARSGSTVRGFINGVLAFTTTDARTYASSQGAYVSSSTAPGQGAIGSMDEVRITHGVARYAEAFTPPAEAFPNR